MRGPRGRVCGKACEAELKSKVSDGPSIVGTCGERTTSRRSKDHVVPAQGGSWIVQGGECAKAYECK